MDNKQLTDLIKRVSTDQKLQLTEDTSLLSEERYPFELSPLFESLTKADLIARRYELASVGPYKGRWSLRKGRL